MAIRSRVQLDDTTSQQTLNFNYEKRRRKVFYFIFLYFYRRRCASKENRLCLHVVSGICRRNRVCICVSVSQTREVISECF